MSHSFSFLYQGIHKYKRQQFGCPFYGDLFVVLFMSTYRLKTSLLATFDVEFNDVFWRHLTASNTQVYNDVSVACSFDMTVVYYTSTVRYNLNTAFCCSIRLVVCRCDSSVDFTLYILYST